MLITGSGSVSVLRPQIGETGAFPLLRDSLGFRDPGQPEGGLGERAPSGVQIPPRAMHAEDQAQRSASIPRPPTGLNRGRHPSPWMKLLRGPLCRIAAAGSARLCSGCRVADGVQGGPGVPAGSLGARSTWASRTEPASAAQGRPTLPVRAQNVCARARPGPWPSAPSLVRRLFLGDGGWREKRDVPSKACSAPPRPGAFHSSLLPASAHPVDERGPPRPRRLLPPPRRAAGLPSGCFGAVSVKKRAPAPQEPAIVDMIRFRQRAASPIRFPLSKFPPQRSRQDPASPRFSKCGEAGRRHMTC